jgi:hypothetical protein
MESVRMIMDKIGNENKFAPARLIGNGPDQNGKYLVQFFLPPDGYFSEKEMEDFATNYEIEYVHECVLISNVALIDANRISKPQAVLSYNGLSGTNKYFIHCIGFMQDGELHPFTGANLEKLKKCIANHELFDIVNKVPM